LNNICKYQVILKWFLGILHNTTKVQYYQYYQWKPNYKSQIQELHFWYYWSFDIGVFLPFGSIGTKNCTISFMGDSIGSIFWTDYFPIFIINLGSCRKEFMNML
jgi:hypothetical protein